MANIPVYVVTGTASKCSFVLLLTGAVVPKFTSESVATQKGMKPGDIVVEVDGKGIPAGQEGVSTLVRTIGVVWLYSMGHTALSRQPCFIKICTTMIL